MSADRGMENPAAIEGTGLEKEAAFVAAFRYLKNRISIFTNLPLRSNSLSLVIFWPLTDWPDAEWPP